MATQIIPTATPGSLEAFLAEVVKLGPGQHITLGVEVGPASGKQFLVLRRFDNDGKRHLTSLMSPSARDLARLLTTITWQT